MDSKKSKPEQDSGTRTPPLTSRPPRSSGWFCSLLLRTLGLAMVVALVYFDPLLISPLTLRGPPSSDVTPPTRIACAALEKTLPRGVFVTPGTRAYRVELKHFWSLAVHDLRPACVVQATSTADVSTTMRLLNSDPMFADVRVGVKSGGHDPNPGDASTHAGVLISLRRMRGAQYHPETGLASVWPGGCWSDVIGALERQAGRTVVGGRLGAVGVGGLLVQGGMSYLSAQYGLPADNIVAWEVVRPDGQVVNVTVESDPDLAVAMKGGGNQFGIVTRFTARTYAIGKVWGGVRFYKMSHEAEVHEALMDFTLHGADEDPRAAVVPTEIAIAYTLKLRGMFVIFMYDGEKPPTTGTFGRLLAIKPLLDVTMTTSYSRLLKLLGVSCLFQARTAFSTATVPAIPGVTKKITEKFWESNLARLRPITSPGFCHATFQPFPAAFGRNSQERGGNAMGLTAADPHRVILELSCMWYRRRDDAVARRKLLDVLDWVEAQLPGWVEEARRLNALEDGAARELQGYMPLFMNDAMYGQDVMGSYRGHDKFRSLQSTLVDPDGKWRARIGGFQHKHDNPESDSKSHMEGKADL